MLQNWVLIFDHSHTQFFAIFYREAAQDRKHQIL
jgi:hypothetical protein